jgi:hypothetical protein
MKAAKQKQRPPWWPTKAQKERADKACRKRLEEIRRDSKR